VNRRVFVMRSGTKSRPIEYVGVMYEFCSNQGMSGPKGPDIASWVVVSEQRSRDSKISDCGQTMQTGPVDAELSAGTRKRMSGMPPPQSRQLWPSCPDRIRHNFMKVAWRRGEPQTHSEPWCCN
jgi:hypothetical protein